MSDGAFQIGTSAVRVAERDATTGLKLEMPESKGQLVVVPVERPATPAKDLFLLMERLDQRMTAAAFGKGTFPGKVFLDRVLDTNVWWGGAMVVASGIGLAMAVHARDPSAFFFGCAAGALAAVGAHFAFKWSNKTLHTLPVNVSHAAPFLDAFKSRDPATQAVVKARADQWADKLQKHDVSGQDLRQQLRELSKVEVNVDDVTSRRINTVNELLSALPATKKDAVYASTLVYALDRLQPEDRAEVAELLLERLYVGETLQGKASTADNEKLYAALIATQPRRITTSDALQKLVRSE
jgi:hypothetical protein